MNRAIPLALCALCTACVSETPAPEPEPATLAERLRAGVTLDFAPALDRVVFRSTIVSGGSEEVFDYSLGAGGNATLILDGDELLLQSLDVEIDDLEISATALPPDGATFAAVRVELAMPVRASTTMTSDAASISAQPIGDLLLDASLVQGDGGLLPLAQQNVPGVQISIELELQGEDIAGRIEASRSGDFFSWTGFVTLSDIVIDIDGAAL